MEIKRKDQVIVDNESKIVQIMGKYRGNARGTPLVASLPTDISRNVMNKTQIFRG
jgi:hypothetical protein